MSGTSGTTHIGVCALHGMHVGRPTTYNGEVTCPKCLAEKPCIEYSTTEGRYLIDPEHIVLAWSEESGTKTAVLSRDEALQAMLEFAKGRFTDEQHG